ncbi:TIGR04086 family membrane protein [Syntrophomonas erecta]
MPIEIKAIGKALIISVLLCLVSGIVVYYSGLQETLLPSLGKIILIISVFWAGCYVSRNYGSKGLVRGISMGIIFFILMLIASLAFNSSISFKNFLFTMIICVISGALGGILGIGLSET